MRDPGFFPPSTIGKEHHVEKPPPYTKHSEGTPPPRLTHPASGPTADSTIHPSASVSQIHVYSKNENITGTFHIDPCTPAHGTHPKIRRQRRGKRKAGGEGPHASFQTRSGDIELQLAAISKTGSDEDRASIVVGSRSGKIKINMLPRNTTRAGTVSMKQPYMGLDVYSRSAGRARYLIVSHRDVIVYIPDTFSGVIRLETEKGKMRVLPRLEGVVDALKRSEEDMIMTIGGGQGGDLCEITTRTGRIVVGLAGKDEYVEQRGFWKRLFGRK